jgi:PAS domain S-box-containing protein
MPIYHDGSFEEREELHRGIVRRSPNPIYLVDVESRSVLDANPATSELLGYAHEELLGLDMYNIDLGNRADQDAVIQRVVENHHDILGERSYRRKDGTLVPVEASANLMIYKGRKVLCLFARDITGRKEAELESKRLHRALAFSQKHEAVGRLAAGIAHDFNNHLMVMLLCAQLVGKSLGPDDPSQAEIGELVDAGNSAGKLIRQLLAFSGRQVLRPKVVDFDETLRNLEKMVRRVIPEDVELISEYGAGEGLVFADPTQLEQVVLNLAVNAKDAMPKGGTLTLSTEQVEVGEDFVEDYSTLSPGPHLMLRVTDTGVGMPADTLDRVFEPFFTTKESGKGTGLGLATVYGIVKQSGGSIWASSKLGSGTTFRIYLPVTTEAPAVDGSVELGEIPDLPGGDETVLLVEDDAMVRTITARILRRLGYVVLEASGSAEAAKIFAEEEGEKNRPGIDLVLTDVIMPEMSGPDMIRSLTEHRQKLKVIFMSGYAHGQIRKEDIFAQQYLFLEKPLSRADLAYALRRTLDS